MGALKIWGTKCDTRSEDVAGELTSLLHISQSDEFSIKRKYK